MTEIADLPILYSFRRCPYAMRARLALQSSGQKVVLREIVLRDKAPEMLIASPKGTVPVLVDNDIVIEQSLDVMHWALKTSDPENWLSMPSEGSALIEQADGPFKTSLDHYKYASRYDDVDGEVAREAACEFLQKLNAKLDGQEYLFGDAPCLADMAILPFVRQFAHVDREWFWSQDWSHLISWLDRFLASERFASIMTKYPKWVSGDPVTEFN